MKGHRHSFVYHWDSENEAFIRLFSIDITRVSSQSECLSCKGICPCSQCDPVRVSTESSSFHCHSHMICLQVLSESFPSLPLKELAATSTRSHVASSSPLPSVSSPHFSQTKSKTSSWNCSNYCHQQARSIDSGRLTPTPSGSYYALTERTSAQHKNSCGNDLLVLALLFIAKFCFYFRVQQS